MPVAALYDIHGNLPALEAVLDDVRRADVGEIIVGGDVVPGPMPRETLERLLDLDIPVRFIRGNGDRVVLARMGGEESSEVPEAFRDVVRWNAEQLEPGHARLIAGWPGTLRAAIPGAGEVMFCHATPRSDTGVFTRLTPEHRVRPQFDGVGVPLVICGHTHMQFDRKIGGTRVVNAGSVGMPFGAPGAYWLLLGPGIELRHTPYDLVEAAERIRSTAYPQAAEFASRNVLRPPSEKEMLDAYAR